MDPVTIPVHDDTTLAMLFGSIMALIKLAEKGVPWLMGRRGRKSGAASERVHVVQLDPAASQAIAEILAHTRAMEDVVDRRDGDGVPLVYFSRRDQARVLEGVDEIRERIRSLVQSKS